MQTQINRRATKRRIRHRIRKKLSGTAARPRVAVFRSVKHIYAQAIDDDQGRTVVQASTLDSDIRSRSAKGWNVEAAKLVGGSMADKLKAAGIERVVFDRGGSSYHGRVQALAEALRSAGVKL